MPLSGTVSFAPGETVKTIAIATVSDSNAEPTETLTLRLSNAQDATLATPEASGTIEASTGADTFTGAFSGVPEEHDGTNEFTLTLTFSDEPEDLSYKTVSDDLFTSEGGTIGGARRLSPPSNQAFVLKVTPSGNEAVTLTLNAVPPCGQDKTVCTAARAVLSGPLGVTVPGPAVISVADAQVHEGPGATLDFVVSLDRRRHAPVSVEYATEPGEAVAGDDYVHTAGKLTFTPGETEHTVSVPVIDDGHDEGTETMRLKLWNAQGARIADDEAIGTIENSDAMPKAWMVRFGRTVGSQVVDALGYRLEASRRWHMTVAGVPITGEAAPLPEDIADDPFGLPEWAKNARREDDTRTITADDLLLRSDFHLSSASDEEGGQAFTTWGRVSTGGFDAEVDDVTMAGDVSTGVVGFDAEWGKLLAGVMLAQSAGKGSYRLDPEQGDDAGTVKSDLTGVYPYARIDLNAQASAWALAGAGSGSITLTQDGGDPMKTDLSMRMGAFGVKGQVLDGSGPSGVGVNIKADAMWVGTKSARSADMVGTKGDVTRLRLVVQGERVFVAGNDATFTPSAEVGLRHDGGDAETGTGVEVGAGLRYIAGPLTIEGQVRTLVAHEASGLRGMGDERGNPRDPERVRPRPLRRPRMGPHRERHRAALVRARCRRARGRPRIRGGGPARNRRRLRLRARAQARRAHALRRDDARRCREPHGAHRHPLAVGPRCGRRARGDPADK